MNFNNVVNTAIKDRNELGKSFHGKLEADIILDKCWLSIYPVNSSYTESSIGHYSYFIHKSNIERVWINHG